MQKTEFEYISKEISDAKPEEVKEEYQTKTGILLEIAYQLKRIGDKIK